MPASPNALLAVLVANAVMTGAALVAGAICAQSMMADAADEHEFLFGVRREGLFFAGLLLAFKAASGVGGFLAGIALDWIHFPTEIAARGGSIDAAGILSWLGIVAGPLPALLTLCAPLVLLGYRLDRARHAEIVARIRGASAV